MQSPHRPAGGDPGTGDDGSLEKGGGLLVARAAIPAGHLDRNFCLPNSREMKQMLLFKILHEGDG